jgi:hypothetical protein
VQWYANDPSVVKVKRKASPLASVPESNAAVSEVAVCANEPEFVQHTVPPPLGRFTVAGLNEYSAIVTTVSPAWQLTAARAFGARPPNGTKASSARTTRESPLFTSPPSTIPVLERIFPGRNVRAGP